LDVAGISRWHFKHRRGVWYGHVLFDYRPSALRLASPSAGTEVMDFSHMFADARMPIWGVFGDHVQLLAVVLKQEWTALVLFRIALNADSVRRFYAVR